MGEKVLLLSSTLDFWKVPAHVRSRSFIMESKTLSRNFDRNNIGAHFAQEYFCKIIYFFYKHILHILQAKGKQNVLHQHNNS